TGYSPPIFREVEKIGLMQGEANGVRKLFQSSLLSLLLFHESASEAPTPLPGFRQPGTPSLHARTLPTHGPFTIWIDVRDLHAGFRSASCWAMRTSSPVENLSSESLSACSRQIVP